MKIGVDPFLNKTRKNLIGLIEENLKELGSGKIQTTIIHQMARKEEKDGTIIFVDKAFNSKLTEIFQGSDFNEVLDGMFIHMKKQIEHPALPESGFVIEKILYLDISFSKLILTRGSSYLPLPDWIAKKKAVINPKNDNDEECFKYAITVALHYEDIPNHPERVCNIKPYTEKYNWDGLEFPLSINKIDKFEKNNTDISVNVLCEEEDKEKIYICRRSKFNDRSKVVNLLMIVDDNKRHYTAIRSLSRLLGSLNSKDGHKRHFCVNCLNSFNSVETRDKHYEYCVDREAVRIEVPKQGSKIRFTDGYKQMKVPFVMYADFESILAKVDSDLEETKDENGKKSYTKKINQHIPSGFCVYSKFAHGNVEDPLKVYRGRDCVEVFCDYIEKEVNRLYNMFPEKKMDPLTQEEWREYNRATRCHICMEYFDEDSILIGRCAIIVIILENFAVGPYDL